jgi:hypothetical protein
LTFNIKHHPIFDTEKVIDHYSKKDGVPIKYVCTSAKDSSEWAGDIFYRGTPHPEFGNRYFMLYDHFEVGVIITSADTIENVEFTMVEGPQGWEYSQHRHDFRSVGNVAIDGGRAYTRLVGDINVPTKTFYVKNGEFHEDRSSRR